MADFQDERIEESAWNNVFLSTKLQAFVCESLPIKHTTTTTTAFTTTNTTAITTNNNYYFYYYISA